MPVNIVYLSPVSTVPFGGIRVLFKHSQILNELGFHSEVFQINQPEFHVDWFKHSATLRLNPLLDPKSDFLVIPEGCASFFSRQCLELGIKYAIFVQNPFQISDFNEPNADNDLRIAYSNATFVLTVSKYATQFVDFCFKNISDKVFQIYPGIDIPNEYKNKKNLITYMPRKMRDQARLIRFMISSFIPSDWEILEIDNVSQDSVYSALSRSKIFLSFSTQEGFGLPPIEAALCNNIVVGYTGQAGKEYFLKPYFYPIECEDIITYAKTVQNIIANFSDFDFCSEDFKRAHNNLQSTYGDRALANNLALFYSLVNAHYV